MKSKLIIGIVLVVFLGLLLYKPIIISLTTEHIDITVTKTDVKRKNSKDVYLVFTKDETFSNEDSFWNFKWNSSDLHGKFQNDSTYTVQVYGVRIPFLSMYRNIVEIDE